MINKPCSIGEHNPWRAVSPYFLTHPWPSKRKQFHLVEYGHLINLNKNVYTFLRFSNSNRENVQYPCTFVHCFVITRNSLCAYHRRTVHHPQHLPFWTIGINRHITTIHNTCDTSHSCDTQSSSPSDHVREKSISHFERINGDNQRLLCCIHLRFSIFLLHTNVRLVMLPNSICVAFVWPK